MLATLKILAALVCISVAAGTGFYFWQASSKSSAGGNTPCDQALKERVAGVMSTAVMDTIEGCINSGYFTPRAVQIAVGNR